MRLLAALLAVVALLGAPEAVRAQDEAAEPAVEPREPPDLPPGDDVITAVAEGSRAPHSGMLLDTDTAIRWTNRLSWFRNELRLVMRTDAEILAAVRRSHETELRLVRESYEREIEGLRGDLRHQAETFAQAQAREHPWFDTFAFGAVVGIVLAGVIVGLTAWAASSM
jgi:hypothetical protein